MTAFSTPPDADTCAPTFQGLLTRGRNVWESASLALDFLALRDFASSGCSQGSTWVNVCAQAGGSTQAHHLLHLRALAFSFSGVAASLVRERLEVILQQRSWMTACLYVSEACKEYFLRVCRQVYE